MFVSQINENDGKIKRVGIRDALLFTLSANFKRMLAGYRFSTHKEVIVKTGAYFEFAAKEKLFKRIEVRKSLELVCRSQSQLF